MSSKPPTPTEDPFIQASILLSQAHQIISQLLLNGDEAMQLKCRDCLQLMVRLCKAGNPAAKVLASLNGESEATPDLDGSMALCMRGLVTNTYDEKLLNPNNRKNTDVQKELHKRTRNLQLTNLVSLISRLRSKHAMPLMSLRRGLENKYLGCPTHLWNISRAFREVPGESWIDRTLASPLVRAWVPPFPEERSTVIDLCCRDNLEWWRSVKYARHIDGVKKDSELIHTVTGEHWFIPQSLTTAAVPDLGDKWPFLGQYNYSDTVVNDAEMHVFLTPLWSKALALIEGKNKMQLLMRPPPEADQRQGSATTPTWHSHVILNCGTSSYLDNSKIVTSVRRDRVAKKSIVACDMQTFVRLWWLKHKFPAKYGDMVPWAGEFHGLAHLVDGIVIMNWAYIYEPILLHFQVTGFHLKLNMKETSQRIRWSIVILSAGLEWLKSVFTPADISNIPNLLKKVQGNVPVWCFIGFLFYHALSIWGFKDAIQVSDDHLLNFMWRFSLRVYAHTNKNNYKKGVLQNSKILFDCEDNVKSVMRKFRTYNDTGRPCASGALDHKNEKASMLMCYY